LENIKLKAVLIECLLINFNILKQAYLLSTKNSPESAIFAWMGQNYHY